MTERDVMDLFQLSHLRPELAQISSHFRDLALLLCRELPKSAEQTLAVRKLWEAKNLAVYAAAAEMNREKDLDACR